MHRRNAALREGAQVEILVANPGADGDLQFRRGLDRATIDRHAEAHHGVGVGQQLRVPVPVDGVVVQPSVDDLGVDGRVDGLFEVEAMRVVAAVGVQDPEAAHPRALNPVGRMVITTRKSLSRTSLVYPR